MKGIEDGMFPLGMVAGGMSDGSINLWNPDAIIKNDFNRSLVARIESHRGNVLALQFHPKQPNLFASGATDSEVLIYDLAKPSHPTFAAAGPKPPGAAEVCALEWNKKVFQIVATSTKRGETSIWDLRQKRSVITFRESTHQQCPTTGLAWNPVVSTQIVASYMNSTPEIWDLRKSNAPKMRLEGGTAHNVLSVAWNPHDHAILTTSGDDGITWLWDTNTGHRSFDLCLKNGQGGIFDLQWNPHVLYFLIGIFIEGSWLIIGGIS